MIESKVQVLTKGHFRLLWLDAARGIAAFSVMLYHYEELLGIRPMFSAAYLSVDLFFMMSGFVLSHSYESKLAGHLTARMYLVARAVRLYPTYLVATGLGFAYYLSKLVMHVDDAPNPLDLVYIVCSNLLFIPVLTTSLVPQGMFPLAPSSWSLATEVIASLLYGLVLARSTTAALGALLCVFGYIFFSYVIMYQTVDLGWTIESFVPGIFRTLFEFTIGVVLFRCSRHLVASRWSPSAFLLIAVSIVLVISSVRGVVEPGLCVLLLFPVFILSAGGGGLRPSLDTAFYELGRISYPIYLLHTPVLLWIAGVYKLLKHQDPLALQVRWLGWAMVIATLVLSYVVARWIDEPVRAALNARLRRFRSIKPSMAKVAR